MVGKYVGSVGTDACTCFATRGENESTRCIQMFGLMGIEMVRGEEGRCRTRLYDTCLYLLKEFESQTRPLGVTMINSPQRSFVSK